MRKSVAMCMLPYGCVCVQLMFLAMCSAGNEKWDDPYESTSHPFYGFNSGTQSLSHQQDAGASCVLRPHARLGSELELRPRPASEDPTHAYDSYDYAADVPLAAFAAASSGGADFCRGPLEASKRGEGTLERAASTCSMSLAAA